MSRQLALWSDEPADESKIKIVRGVRSPVAHAVKKFPQLLKWIGNKHRYAHEIASYFPAKFGVYFEPFLGSGAVLGTVSPDRAVASDVFYPLMEIWTTLKESPDTLKQWYSERWQTMQSGEKVSAYEQIKASYNKCPNGADLLFLCRSCYGGVVRFRQSDGYMSTPCGPHAPVSPESFAHRVDIWIERTKGATFLTAPFQLALAEAQKGDLVYCDPPYSHTQSILYGAQGFDLVRLFSTIRDLKQKGVFVALSIDGTKKSGNSICDIPIPDGLFEREIFVNCGRSMLKRFQMKNKSLEEENVSDRLLLTY
jgi:DNA adenine methylase